MKSGPPPSPAVGAHPGPNRQFDAAVQFRPRERLAVVLLEWDVIDGQTGDPLPVRTWICGKTPDLAISGWVRQLVHAGIEPRTSVLVNPKPPKLPQWMPGAQKKVQRQNEPKLCGCGKIWHHNGNCQYRRWMGRGMPPHDSFVPPETIRQREREAGVGAENCQAVQSE